MKTKIVKNKYYSSLIISLVYLVISSLYIIFSDTIVASIFGDSLSVEVFTAVAIYKGLVFVFVTSVILFVLIQREIKIKRKTIRELEAQKQHLTYITAENEKVKKRLQERNIYIETLLKYLPIGLAVNRIDDGKTIYMNKSFTEIYGWSEKELCDLNHFFNIVYPDEQSRKIIKKRVLEDLESGDPERMRWKGIEIKTSKGKKKIINAQNIPVYDQNLMISTVSDVTAQSKTEKKVIESEAKFATLFKLNPAAIVFTRLSDGLIMEVNQAYIDLFGYSEAELISQPTKRLPIWESDIQRNNIVAQLTQKGSIHNFESRAVCKNGEVIETLSYLQTIEYQGTKSIIAIILDITEKKRNEVQLKESRILLEKIINNLNEVVLLVEPDGRYIQLANTAVEKIFGYTQQEIIGKKTEILHVNQEMSGQFAALGEPELEKKGVFHTEFQMKHKNGSIIDTENTVSTILETDGWKLGVVSVIRDITEQKKSEIKLKEYQDALKQLTMEISLAEEKQRKEIAANIHDHLSQLLVVSRMKLKDLLNETTNTAFADDLKTVVKFISEALENTRKITYELSPPVLYELGLIEAMYWLAEKTQDEHPVKTKFTTDLKEIELSETKLILIFRIIQELVNNTVKHAQADHLEMAMNVTDDLLKITVVDDGVGFDQDSIPKVKAGEGGFGLFAVKERVQNLNGNISIHSRKNEGTTIKIQVPL